MKTRLERVREELAQMTTERDAYRAVVEEYVAGFYADGNEALFQELGDFPKLVAALKVVSKVAKEANLTRPKYRG